MTIKNKHTVTAIDKIQSCRYTTDYTHDGLMIFVGSAVFLLRTIAKINNMTVVAKTYIDKDFDLVIQIKDIKFHHNMMMIYAERPVLKFIKEYIHELLNNKCESAIKYGIKISGDCHGNAAVFQY